jgi:tRNA threonylcarbamoyladenosine biosynthesis protein TsaB
MLLAIDTSTTQLGLALYDGAQVIAEYAWRSRHRHTAELAPAVQDLLARCGLSMDAVGALGVALGPGSFTSLRVGLAFTKGLALARALPLIGIPTLDILAHAQPVTDRPLAVALQAGRGRFALSLYQVSGTEWQAAGEARVVTLEAWLAEAQGPLVMCGEFTAEDRLKIQGHEHIQLASPTASLRRPAVLAELAWARWQRGAVDDPAGLAPLYLHIAEPIA